MLRVHVVGTARIDGPREPVSAAAGTTFGLLLFLAAHSGTVVDRPALWRLFFPKRSHDRARHNLRQLVYKLRHSGWPVESTRDGLLVASNDVAFDYLDASEFLRSAPGLARVSLGILPTFEPSALPEYTEWLDGFRASVERHLRGVLVREMVLAKGRSDWNEAERLAAGCLALDPLNEEAVLIRAEALARTGAKSRAVDSLDAYLTEVDARPDDFARTAAALRKRVRASVAEYESALVGREELIANTDRVIETARAGQNSALIVEGEAGGGKSRMVREVSLRAELAGCSVAQVHCTPSSLQSPGSAFSRFAERLLTLRGAAGADRHCLEAVRAIALGQPLRPTASAARDSAIRDLVLAITCERPLVLVIDDADAIEEAFATTVRALLGNSVPGFGMIAFVGTSTGRVPFGFADLPATSLLPLSADDACRLVEAALESSCAASLALADAIVREGCGNPKLLLALAREAAVRGAVPVSSPALMEAVTNRVARLSADARLLLQIIEASNNAISCTQLDSACELPGYRLIAAIAELESQQLVSQAGDALIQAMPAVQRMSRMRDNRPISQSFAQLRLDRGIKIRFPGYPALSHLWESGQRWSADERPELAYETFRMAGRHAQKAGLPGLGLPFFERALACAPEPTSAAEMLEAIALCGAARAAWPTVLAATRRLRELGKQSGTDYCHEAALHLRETQALFGLGQTAAAQLRMLLGEFSDAHVSGLERLNFATTLVQLAEMDFDTASALEVKSHVDEQTRGELHEPTAIHFYMVFETTFGSHRTAADLAHQLRSILLSTPLDTQGLRWLGHLGYVLRRAGSVDEARFLSEEGYNFAQAASFDPMACLTASELATLAWLSNDGVTALRWHQIAGRHLARMPRGQAPGVYFSNEVNFAIDSADSNRARLILESIEHDAPVLVRPGHQALTTLAFRCLAQAIDDEPPTPEQAEELLNGHVRGRDFSLHDVIAEATYVALSATDRQQHGAALLKEYVAHHRRDRHPLPRRFGERILGSLPESPAKVTGVAGEHEGAALA